MRQSHIATGIGAILIIISTIWLYTRWQTMTEFEKLISFILICIFIAIDTIVYYVIEMYYDIYPLIQKIGIIDQPIARLQSIFNKINK
jgi:hypothetical protein